MTSTTTTGRITAVADRPPFRELWFQVVLGAVLGIVVGLTLPAVGIALKPLNDWFIALVKMIVVPVIFCVLTRRRVDGQPPQGRPDRREGPRLLLVLSLLSMLIGLVVANIFKPGAGMNIDPAPSTPRDPRSAAKELDARPASSPR